MCDVELTLHQTRIPVFPVPGRRDRRVVARQGVPARPRVALRDGHAGAPGAPRLRARRHHLDGLRRLLPDRRGLHPVRARAGHPDDLPGQRAGLDRDLHARHHAGRPDRLRPAVRAVPEPGPGDDAGHRRRLPGRPARRGHRLRLAQVRPGPRRPDHHVRHDARPGRDPGRRARARPLVRRGGPRRQGRPEPARDQARGGARDARRSSASSTTSEPGRQADDRLREAARGRRPERLDPRRGRRHLATSR